MLASPESAALAGVAGLVLLAMLVDALRESEDGPGSVIRDLALLVILTAWAGSHLLVLAFLGSMMTLLGAACLSLPWVALRLSGKRKAAGACGEQAVAVALIGATLWVSHTRTLEATRRLAAHLVQVTEDLEAFEAREGRPFVPGRDGPDPLGPTRVWVARHPGIPLRIVERPGRPVRRISFTWFSMGGDEWWNWPGHGWSTGDGQLEGPCCATPALPCEDSWGPYAQRHRFAGPDGRVPPLPGTLGGWLGLEPVGG